METMEKRKRPVWVWVISIFYFFSAGYTLLSFYLIHTGVVSLAPAQQAYFNNLSIIDYGITILIASANLLAAIALFLLRKQCFHLFLGAFCAGVLLAILHSITKGWVAALGGSGLVGALIGWCIAIAVIIYSKNLTNKGILV